MTSEEFAWFKRAAEALEIIAELTPVQAEQPTLRDQFAMAALSGLLVNPDCDAEYRETYATAAYTFADAMMEARKL